MSISTTLKSVASNMSAHIPEDSPYNSLDEALKETTHLLIVAHADDDGLIGAEALSETYGIDQKHMSVIVVSASPGTGRPPGYKQHTDQEMVTIRQQEQINAADTGQYACTIQLGFSSAAIKESAQNTPYATQGITNILKTIVFIEMELDNKDLSYLKKCQSIYALEWCRKYNNPVNHGGISLY